MQGDLQDTSLSKQDTVVENKDIMQNESVKEGEAKASVAEDANVYMKSFAPVAGDVPTTFNTFETQNEPLAHDAYAEQSNFKEQNIPILQCGNLVKRYGRNTALAGISFMVNSGRILGILGPNESGKTTFLKLAAGLLTPTSGKIFIDGTVPGPYSKEIVSYMPDRNYLDGDMTFKSSCKLFKRFYRDFDVELATMQVRELGIDQKSRFKFLSKGTRDKIQLILAMSRNARLYILDEPIAGVDPVTRDYILNVIIKNRAKGSAVIISTHLIQDVEKILDDVLFLKNGNIALYNSAKALRSENKKTIDELFRDTYAYNSYQENVK